MGRKLFCDISPTCYEISLRKEIMRRHIKDFFCREKIDALFPDERRRVPFGTGTSVSYSITGINFVKATAYMVCKRLDRQWLLYYEDMWKEKM